MHRFSSSGLGAHWRAEVLRTNLWLVPGIEVVAAIVLFAITTGLDHAAYRGEFGVPSWVISGTADAARQILTAIAAAVITVSALSALRAHIPEVREGRPEQRIPQILRPRRSACPDSHAYDPLDRFHMPVAPFLNALVDIKQGLTDPGRRSRILIDFGQQRPDIGISGPRLARVPVQDIGRNRPAVDVQIAQQRLED